MSSTTISQSTTLDSIPRKKRSSHHPSNPRVNRAAPGKWKLRPARPQIQLTQEERKQAYDLLKNLGDRKRFRLPSDLPPWSPPKHLEDINQDLTLMRDYGPSPTDPDRPQPTEDRVKQPLDSGYHQIEKAVKPSRSTHDPTPKQSPSNSVPPVATVLPTAITAESSASSISSIPHSHPRNPKDRHANSDEYHDGPDSREVVTRHTRDHTGGSLKGKEKGEPAIDWSGWEQQVYTHDQIDIIRKRYDYRAKELKRTSDAQRSQLGVAQSAEKGPTTLKPDELQELSNLAAVGSVESLLLFTQSFLCFDVLRSNNGVPLNRSEHYHQWSSMTGFLSVAKSTARRSGIDLTLAICMMYESLLLDKLVDADRPSLLNTYAQETNPDQQLEGFKKIKRMLQHQEHSKLLWLSAAKILEKILSSPSLDSRNGVDEQNNKHKGGDLPRLRSLVKQMKFRERNQSPKLLSLDRPYRFCWPIDKTNPDSMSDFVVFSRAALDEFLDLNQDKIPFRLTRFDDFNIIFPHSGHRRNSYHDRDATHHSSSTGS